MNKGVSEKPFTEFTEQWEIQELLQSSLSKIVETSNEVKNLIPVIESVFNQVPESDDEESDEDEGADSLESSQKCSCSPTENSQADNLQDTQQSQGY